MLQIALERFGFRPRFDCTLTFLPDGGAPILQFCQPNQTSDASGPLVRVRPDGGEEWYGTFQQGGYPLSIAACGPSPEHLCVVAGGAGYVVPVRTPAEYFTVRSTPVLEVHRVPDRPLLLFIDFWNVAAYGPSGLQWFAEGVSFDGIRISSITPQIITGITAGDEFHSGHAFEIDVQSGRVKGGYVGDLRRSTAPDE